ncbi:MmgE/PrpD family protein [Tritonibacter sp. SIMBA_163]|uniref:MmgE/PrpD family protein n=1 Tax=Tritonibacter sp. SIMBA_163 TaxID=3080868 RepID=UPI0039807CE1
MRPTDDQGFDPITGFTHGLKPEAIPAAVLQMARRCLMDTLAVWAGGSTSKPARIAYDHAARRYPGELPMPFDGRRVNPVGYAFAGACSTDALDGHDGHQLCKGHASAALVPMLLAELGLNPDCTLDEMLTHLIVGEEIAIRAGLSLHDTAADYHSSGAWNAMGAAAMGARMRGLNAEKTRHALGIAEYYAPRAPMMRCIDHPSMVKDSTSWGALTGASALDLAEDGFTGAPASICVEAPQYWQDLGQHWRILETNFKAYPVCRWAHPPIEAALGLMRARGIAVDDIASVTVSTFAAATRLATMRPADGDQAQYSMPLCLAVAILEGTILPAHILPEAFDIPEVWGLVDRITLTEDPKLTAIFPAQRLAVVTIDTHDGRRLTSSPTDARGNFDAPLGDDELLAKCAAYLAEVLPTESAATLAALVRGPHPTPAELIAALNRRT